MKYCGNCGSEIKDNASFCSNCGCKVETGNTANQNNANTSYNRPVVNNKSIVTAVILTIVTCGIYGIIWFINLVDDVNRVCQDDNQQSGGTVFLLTLVTCGIYGIIWFYQCGKRMHEAGKKYGMEINDNSVMYLVLNLVGFSIVNYCLVQSDLNRFSVQ